jgi:hypothetical protein
MDYGFAHYTVFLLWMSTRSDFGCRSATLRRCGRWWDGTGLGIGHWSLET